MQPNGLENYVVLDLVGEGSFGKVGIILGNQLHVCLSESVGSAWFF
jgi:hypothetical protein